MNAVAMNVDERWLMETMARQYVAGGERRTFWGPGHQELIDERPDEWRAAIVAARAKRLPGGAVVVDDAVLDPGDPVEQEGRRGAGPSSGGHRRPAPRGLIESDPDLVPTEEEIRALRDSLGRKFEPTDLTPGLRAAAVTWLLGTKHEPGSWALDVAIKVAAGMAISDGQAKGALNVMTARRAQERVNARGEVVGPRPEVPKAALSEGMYAKDGRFYRVKRSRESGRLYAMELVEHGPGLGRGEFVYARGAIFELTAADRMTLEQAAEYGVAHGWCCVCGRHLTDPKSIAAGIGPVCAKHV